MKNETAVSSEPGETEEPQLNQVSSSTFRQELYVHLYEVHQTGKPKYITHNGECVGILTRDAPRTKIPPMWLKFGEARLQWGEMIDCLRSLGARFEFRPKIKEYTGPRPARVYLIPGPDRNKLAKAWQDHIREQREQNAVTPTEELVEKVESYQASLSAEVDQAVREAMDQLLQDLSNKILSGGLHNLSELVNKARAIGAGDGQSPTSS